MRQFWFYGAKILFTRDLPRLPRTKSAFIVRAVRGYYVEIGEASPVELVIRVRLRNVSRKPLTDVRVRFFGVREDVHQRILKVEPSVDCRTDATEAGLVHEVVVEKLPPRREERIEVRYELKLRPFAAERELTPACDESFLEERPFQRTTRQIAELAREVRGESLVETLWRLSAWVARNLRYEMTYARKGSTYALERRAGACIEVSDLSVAVLRMLGVPARVVRGMFCSEYHAWIEVKTRELGWIPSDVLAGMVCAIGTPWVSVHAEIDPREREATCSARQCLVTWEAHLL